MGLPRDGRPAPPEVYLLLLDGEPVECEVRRSARRRRSVAFGVEGARVRVLAPANERWEAIEPLLLKRAAWLRQRLATGASRPTTLTDGFEVPFDGETLRLRVVRPPMRRAPRPRRDGDDLIVSVPATLSAEAADAAIDAQVRSWLQAAAKPLLVERAARWAAATGLIPARVEVRAQRRRWGSCARNGVVRLNWRLILLPPPLIDYVVVHELCHLAEASHGPAFWSRVASFLPDHRALRAELRRLEANLPL